MSRVFSRGLNFQGQLGIGSFKSSFERFVEPDALRGKGVKCIGAHLAQSFALTGKNDSPASDSKFSFRLEDHQIVSWGWTLDSFTTNRTLSFYHSIPRLIEMWQVKAIQMHFEGFFKNCGRGQVVEGMFFVKSKIFLEFFAEIFSFWRDNWVQNWESSAESYEQKPPWASYSHQAVSRRIFFAFSFKRRRCIWPWRKQQRATGDRRQGLPVFFCSSQQRIQIENCGSGFRFPTRHPYKRYFLP
jgi:hypothetical protein